MNDAGWSLLGILLLTMGSLFFSLNHFALRGFSRIKLQEMFKDANRGDIPASFLKKQEKILALCLFLALAADVGIVILLVRLLSNSSMPYVLSFLAGFLVLSIVHASIPQAWSKYTPEAVLFRTHRLLCSLAYLTEPFWWACSLHDRFVRRLAGVTNGNGDQSHEEKQEEFLNVVEQVHMEGGVDEEEMEMIENVLELRETTAEEIMTPRTDLVVLNVDADRETVLRTISQAGFSRIPVYEGNLDNIIGLVYAKDLLLEVGREGQEFRLREKIRKAYFVPESKPLRALLHEFQNQKLHIAVVLDEYGGTAGIVTIEDILEELVGEILDEYEESPSESMKKVDERTVEMDARTYVDDLNDEFELSLPEEDDYDTVGGFVFSHLGYIPRKGEIFQYENLKFTIVDAETRKINRIRIEKLGRQDPGGQV
ncbi:MAG: HlyC/CorC family transporter [Sedimentisphaerales bacterium]|nr:HlyC/CorC family transporter [Sedimentisphaerales bacterium]